MARDPSRWWYALIPFPVLVCLRYGLMGLTRLVLPTAGPSRSEALPVLLLGLGTSLVGALVVVSAPLFIAGVVLDVRALRAHAGWTPHWGYGVLGLVPLLGVVVEWVSLVSIPVAIGYLAIRRRRIGHPPGYGQSVDMETTTGTVHSSIQPPPSRWRYGVVIPPILELSGVIVFFAVQTTGMLRAGSDPLTLLIPAGLVLIAVGFVPLFAISLYLDAKAVRDTSKDQRLEPRVWGLLGLCSLVGLVLFRISFMPIVALAYEVDGRFGNRP